MAAFSFLDRSRTVAAAGFSRWLVPPAALAVHLSIGQVYAFSVFKNPLLSLKAADGTAWSLKELGYIFSIAIAVLGLSAALFGKWLESAGPRKATFVSATCFGSGLLLRAIGGTLPFPSPDLSRIRHRWRYRTGTRLHFSGIDAHQVVSRQAGPRHRPRHHGLWR